LMLLDVMMPGLSGLVVCQRLRSDPLTMFQPIILVTSLTRREDRLAGIDAGADDFLTKPIDPLELVARVRSLLRISQQRDEIERLKNEFTSMLVHDLRSPLNSILGFGQLLVDDAFPEERQDSAARIVSSAERMLRLVNDILDVSRLGAGFQTLTLTRLAPGPLLNQAVVEILPQANRRNIQVQMAPMLGMSPILADEGKLRQILTNVLDNAIKFAAHLVRIEADMIGDWLRIRISDDGVGVSDAERPALWQAWHQTATGRKSRQGSGLGLAIVKGLVEAHGGQISAERAALGGLAIVFTLPMAPPPA
ncbi:MAG: HAMP domain-containing histidine kinase, partial [Candidatus Sericytochromatia bacterium]|nr:HAMP domain-containing histidine kinase [Candidatus Sericytochromatia bacterium]